MAVAIQCTGLKELKNYSAFESVGTEHGVKRYLHSSEAAGIRNVHDVSLHYEQINEKLIAILAIGGEKALKIVAPLNFCCPDGRLRDTLAFSSRTRLCLAKEVYHETFNWTRRYVSI